MTSSLERLAGKIRACRVCIDTPEGRPLPHAPRPVLRVSVTARLAVVGQAPGTRVHRSGVPFSDPSGERLRSWMGVSSDEFYDLARVAIVPMGFCFPGHDVKGADLPPRRECARTWHDQIFARLQRLDLVLLVGGYAQRWHLGEDAGATLTDTVRDWRRILGRRGRPAHFPLPHPSWRNNAWLRQNPWFEDELLPALRARVRNVIGASNARATS